MRQYRVVFSSVEPNVREAIWAKPVEGGFTLYLLEGGVWKPVLPVDDNETPQNTADDVC